MVTDARRAYRELADLDRLKSDFTAIASHELRTPIGLILGHGALLAETLNDPEQRKQAETIVKSALRLKAIVEDLSNIEKVQQEQLNLQARTIDIAPLIVEAVNSFTERIAQKGLRVITDYPESGLELVGDAEKITIAISNLVKNAVTFTDRNGLIMISAEKLPGYVHVSVIDDGIGIPEKDQPRIFERFYQVEIAPHPATWRHGPGAVRRQGDGGTARRANMGGEPGRAGQQFHLLDAVRFAQRAPQWRPGESGRLRRRRRILVAEPSPQKPNLIRLLFEVKDDPALQHQAVDATPPEPRLLLLRAWQADRLAYTYADLLSDPDTAAGCRFFLDEIYGPQDFSQRDADFQRLYDGLTRFLPERMLWILKEALELNRLSHALDRELLDVLVAQLGLQDRLTPEMYAEAYRRGANYAVRVEQIERLAALVLELGGGTKLPLVGLTLRAARLPAQAAGWHELYDFLRRGYAAFRPMKDVPAFAAAIRQRERQLLDAIYAGAENPFGL